MNSRIARKIINTTDGRVGARYHPHQVNKAKTIVARHERRAAKGAK